MNIEFSYAFVIYVGPSAQATNNIYPVSEIHHIEAARIISDLKKERCKPVILNCI